MGESIYYVGLHLPTVFFSFPLTLSEYSYMINVKRMKKKKTVCKDMYISKINELVSLVWLPRKQRVRSPNVFFFFPIGGARRPRPN